MITLIAAVAEGGAIGRDGGLLWHIPEDLKHFKSVTMGAPVIMGRVTWESLPFRPLPGRLNIIITSDGCYQPKASPAGRVPKVQPVIARGLQEALEIARPVAEEAGNDIFIIGGQRVYAEAMPYSDALELTQIPLSAPDADAFFPHIDETLWEEENDEEIEVAHPGNPGATIPIRFVRFRRKA